MKLADVAMGLATILTVVLIFFTGLLGWYQFIDGTFYKPPIEFESTVFRTEKCWYVPGETVRAIAKFRKNRNIPGRVKWNLVDNRMFEFTSKPVTLPAGDYNLLFEVCKLPEHFPTNGPDEKWQFKGIVEYKINPIKSVSYAIETTEFIILKEPPLASDKIARAGAYGD